MERALIRLKYGGDLTVAKSLAEFLAPDNQPDLRLHGVDVVVPIPLHPKRLKERGYDQATVLAQQVARLWKRPMVLTALKRDKATRSQVGLTVDARQQNVREAFAVSKRGGGKIAGKRVLVVDDVMTTGATGAEAAKELKKAGAKSVCLLTAARATKWS